MSTIRSAHSVAKALRDRIHSGYYSIGQRLEDERSLAAAFSVSRGTLRQSLDILAEERLVIRQQGRGTFVADATYTRDNQTRADLISLLVYEREYYFGPVILEASSQASRRGFMLTTGSNANDKEEFNHIQASISSPVQGVVIAPRNIESTAAHAMLTNADIPVVLLDTIIPGVHEDLVRVDNHRGTYVSTQHLVELGHRRIAYIGHDGDTDTPCRDGRREGFLAATRDMGLSVPDRWVIETDRAEPTTPIAELLQSKNRPTAFVAYNDTWAIRVIAAARKLSLSVPHDLSVVGFDNSSLARQYDVPLTSINPEPEELGAVCVNRLIEKILRNNAGPKRTILITPSLIVRESTAVPKD